MFGFVFGTMCLFGLFALFKAGRGRHHWHHHHAHGGWRRHGRERWGSDSREGGQAPWFEGRFSRAAAEVVKRRLRVDDDQEGIVDHALADLGASARELWAVFGQSRTDLAEAFRGEAVDEAAVAGVFARQDEELSRARRDMVSALKQIHAVLTPDQRKTAVQWASAADARWV